MRHSIIILLITLFPPFAFAEGENKFYLSGSIGFLSGNNVNLGDQKNIQDDPDHPVFFKGYKSSNSMEGELSTGSAALIEIGMRLGKNWRLGIEAGHRRLDFNSISGQTSSYYQEKVPGFNFYNPPTSKITGFMNGDTNLYREANPDIDNVILDAKGQIESISAMINIYRDFQNKSFVTPYLGGGIGLSFETIRARAEQAESKLPYRVDASFEDDILVYEATTYSTYRGGEYNYTNKSTNLGYQFMLGLGIALTKNIHANGGYRYFGSTGEIQTHSFETGIRYEF